MTLDQGGLVPLMANMANRYKGEDENPYPSKGIHIPEKDIPANQDRKDGKPAASPLKENNNVDPTAITKGGSMQAHALVQDIKSKNTQRMRGSSPGPQVASNVTPGPVVKLGAKGGSLESSRPGSAALARIPSKPNSNQNSRPTTPGARTPVKTSKSSEVGSPQRSVKDGASPKSSRSKAGASASTTRDTQTSPVKTKEYGKHKYQYIESKREDSRPVRQTELHQSKLRLGEKRWEFNDLNTVLKLKTRAGEIYAHQMRDAKASFYAFGNTRFTQTIGADFTSDDYWLMGADNGPGTNKRIGPYSARQLLDLYIADMVNDKTILHSDRYGQKVYLGSTPELKSVLNPDGGYFVRTKEMVEKAARNKERMAPRGPFQAMDLRYLFFKKEITVKAEVAAPFWDEWIAIENLPELRHVVVPKESVIGGLRASLLVQCAFRRFRARQELKARRWKYFCASKIQATWRAYVIRCHFLRDRWKIIHAQRCYRTQRAKKQFMKTFGMGRRRIILVQKCIRRNICLKSYGKARRGMICVQARWRRYWDYTHFAAVKKAVIKIQSIYRMFAVRRWFKYVVLGITKFQGFVRGYQAWKNFHLTKRKIITIQSLWRGFVQRRWLEYLHGRAVLTQKTWRGFVQHAEYKWILRSVLYIQRVYKAYRARLFYLAVKKYIVKIQAFWRRYLVRVQWHVIKPLVHEAAVTIQTWWRSIVANEVVLQRRIARRGQMLLRKASAPEEYYELLPFNMWSISEKIIGTYKRKSNRDHVGSLQATLNPSIALENSITSKASMPFKASGGIPPKSPGSEWRRPHFLQPLNEGELKKRDEYKAKHDMQQQLNQVTIGDRSLALDQTLFAPAKKRRSKKQQTRELLQKYPLPEVRGSSIMVWCNLPEDHVDEPKEWGVLPTDDPLKPNVTKGLPFQRLLGYLMYTKPDQIVYTSNRVNNDMNQIFLEKEFSF